ncbi:fimbrial protein [Aliidiomarina indica]|uniref:fimbrial protein n=1 Tax=Aliidiomarina indica TaxID=2749147 RepID=UPI00188F4C72|nr:hypothetical protein [Aliidiomarina indica]
MLLPTVNTSDLSTAGSTAGETTFTLALSGCSGTATTTQTNFVGNNVDANGNLANIVADGYATNVALQLLDAPGGAAIDLNSTINTRTVINQIMII